MRGWLSGKSKNKQASNPQSTVLERKTAEIKERLSRMSFRRHSAPAQPGRLEPEDYGARIENDESNAVVLQILPVHLLELVLRHLSLKDLASSAAMTHSTWRQMAMNETLWRTRLQDKLPVPLLNTFKLCRDPWARQVNAFYSCNLISNAIFANSGMTVEKGLGKAGPPTKGWRVQFRCWDLSRDHEATPLCQSCGGDNKIKVLTLTTPDWTLPEASQEIDLIAALRKQGMHPLDAADYLDTSPEIEFSVWASCGDKQPDAWQKGFAAVVLDDGVQRGAAWEGMKLGTQIFRQSAKALWISWVIDPTLLQGSNTVKTYAHLDLSRGRFRKLSCVFSGYPKGVRRAHILLKGLDPRTVYQGPAPISSLRESMAAAIYVALVGHLPLRVIAGKLDMPHQACMHRISSLSVHRQL